MTTQVERTFSTEEIEAIRRAQIHLYDMLFPEEKEKRERLERLRADLERNLLRECAIMTFENL